MGWSVQLPSKVLKQIKDLPDGVSDRFFSLLKEIELLGPIRGTWKNYGKLGKSGHHCHIKSGRPTYVACWEVLPGGVKVVEVTYVGTHEKAPY